MRPVTRGARGTYPPDIDVSSQANLDASLGNFQLTFAGKASPKATALWGTNTPTARQVLYALYNLIFWDGKPPAKKTKGPPSNQAVDAVKGTLTNNLSDVYGAAAGPLEEQLGRFCSFCEIFYPGGLAVEHVVPKAPYPLFYIAWDNFLLACTVCNSSKLSKPPRNDPLFAPAPANEVGYFDTILDSYLWPHRWSDIYRVLPPKLQYYNGTTWKNVPHPVEDGTIITGKDNATRVIRGDVVVNTASGKRAWRLNVPVRVWLEPSTPRGTNMVALAGLNKASGLTRSDVRMWLRTQHWFKVLSALQKVRAAGDFDEAWELMMMSVQQPGFYTNWVAVIDAMGPNGAWTVPMDGTPVMTRFLTEITGEDYFPGTDTANTP